MQGSQTMLNINWKRKYFYRVNSQWIASGVFFRFGQVPQFHWFGWRSIHHYHHAICSYFWPSYHIISNHISYQAVVFSTHRKCHEGMFVDGVFDLTHYGDSLVHWMGMAPFWVFSDSNGDRFQEQSEFHLQWLCFTEIRLNNAPKYFFPCNGRMKPQ